MANQYAPSISANQVGPYFVKQYYQVYRQQRDSVHQFYDDSSSVCRVDGESVHTASDITKIHQLIMSSNFTGIEVRTINSMESLNGGVLVVVCGSAKSKDFMGWRRFVQTFFLAPQERGYYVLNDVFQFVDGEAVYQHSMNTASGLNFDYQPTVATHLSDPPVSDYPSEDEDTEQGYAEHHQELQEQYPEQVHEEIYEPENAAMSEEEHEKLSYASILRAKGKSSAPSFDHGPASTWSIPPAVEKNHVPEPTVQQKLAPVPPSWNNGAVENSFSLEGEPLSVYVRNLSPSVTTFDLAEAFKNFGTIRPDGVFLKKRQDNGVCYAFVEYEDIRSVHNALQASPIQLRGRQVYIEERRPNNPIAIFGGRRGGRGRGRGGRFFGRGNDHGSSNGFRGGY